VNEPEIVQEAKERYERSRLAWTDRRAAALTDMKYVNVSGGQWDPAVKSARENSDPPRPALEFNELHTFVQRIVNEARQQRPSIKVTPGDDGDPETAEAIEGKVRHVQYVSQAGVAYDGAVEAASTGGFGYFEIERAYTDGPAGKSHNLEPRIRRILDPMTVYPDPDCLEPDYSDMKFCHVRVRYSREAFKDEFGIEPTPFDAENPDHDWADEDNVWVSKYWWIKTSQRSHIILADGTEGYSDELEKYDPEDVLSERESESRQVFCSIVDGSRELERTPWPGDWIPVIPVLGREVVVDGKRILLSAVRFQRDGQKLKNVLLTDAAESLGSANRSVWIGPTGSFKDGKWRNGKRNLYMEYTPVQNAQGQQQPPPSFNTYEPPIQGLMAMGTFMGDQIKKSGGYTDDVLRPSQADLSGVAVMRRSQQSDLTNFHFLDNLVRSQWHAGRILIQLLISDTDTPRAWSTRSESGKVTKVPVTMEMSDGSVPQVPGYEGQKHHRIDQGEYTPDIQTGPSFASQRDEEIEMLTRLVESNPQLFPVYGDLLFEKMGYQDLAARAKALLPPQVQQAEQAQAAGQDPQVIQMQQRLQQMSQMLQKLMQDRQGKVLDAQAHIQGKTIDAQSKLQAQKLKTMGDIIVEGQKQGHDAAKHTLSEHTDAIEHMMDMLHESQMAPAAPGEPGYVDPNAQPAPGAAQTPNGGATQ
jgi:hypothetical protein